MIKGGRERQRGREENGKERITDRSRERKEGRREEGKDGGGKVTCERIKRGRM